MNQIRITSFIRKNRIALIVVFGILLSFLVVVFWYLYEQKNEKLANETRTEIKSNKEQETGNKKGNLKNKFEIIINQMSFEEKVGQILLTSLDGYELSSDEFNLLKNGSVSGFLLFSKNIKDEEQVKKLTFEINITATASASASEIVPIIAIDQEGGNVSRIDWIENTSQNEIKTEKEAYKIAKERGKKLNKLGIWMNMAPVVECNSNSKIKMQNAKFKKEESFIYKQKRGFLNDCDKLAWSMVDGYKKSKILGVAKHFPDGLSITKEDPHLILPEISLSKNELDWSNYEFLIEKGIEALMVTHLIYPKIDSEVTSRSDIFIREILRKSLGFDGLVIIDDLSMGALAKENLGEFVVNSVKSGGDLFIVSNRKDYGEVYEYLVRLEDKEFEKRLEESVCRILRIKENYGN